MKDFLSCTKGQGIKNGGFLLSPVYFPVYSRLFL